MQKTLRYCFGLVGTVSFLINPASAQQLSFPSSSPPNQASQTQSAQLTVKEIIIVGSTALSSPELDAIKAPYIGKTGTLQEIQADIQAMVQAIAIASPVKT